MVLRFISRSDSQNERMAVAQPHDVGLDTGGRGEILMKVSAENVT